MSGPHDRSPQVTLSRHLMQFRYSGNLEFLEAGSAAGVHGSAAFATVDYSDARPEVVSIAPGHADGRVAPVVVELAMLEAAFAGGDRPAAVAESARRATPDVDVRVEWRLKPGPQRQGSRRSEAPVWDWPQTEAPAVAPGLNQWVTQGPVPMRVHLGWGGQGGRRHELQLDARHVRLFLKEVTEHQAQVAQRQQEAAGGLGGPRGARQLGG